MFNSISHHSASKVNPNLNKSPVRTYQRLTCLKRSQQKVKPGYEMTPKQVTKIVSDHF